MKPLPKCTHCLAGDLRETCEESTCPFWSEPGTVPSWADQIREIASWKDRREHDSWYALKWAGVCFLAAMFAVLALTVGGVRWGQ